MFVTETRVAVGEEVIEEWEQKFERDKYRIEDYKLISEMKKENAKINTVLKELSLSGENING